jgi:hypothetical protein
MSYLCEDERRLPWRSYRTASFWSATRWPSLLGDPAMLSSRSVRGFPLVCGAPVDFWYCGAKVAPRGIWRFCGLCCLWLRYVAALLCSPELSRAVWEVVLRGRARRLPCSSVQTLGVCSRVYVDVHVAMAGRPGLGLGGPAHLVVLFQARPLGRLRDHGKVGGGNHGGSRRRHAGASRESYFWRFR